MPIPIVLAVIVYKQTMWSFMWQCLLVSYLNMHLPLFFDVLWTQVYCQSMTTIMITLLSMLSVYRLYRCTIIMWCVSVFPMLSYMKMSIHICFCCDMRVHCLPTLKLWVCFCEILDILLLYQMCVYQSPICELHRCAFSHCFWLWYIVYQQIPGIKSLNSTSWPSFVIKLHKHACLMYGPNFFPGFCKVCLSDSSNSWSNILLSFICWCLVVSEIRECNWKKKINNLKMDFCPFSFYT